MLKKTIKFFIVIFLLFVVTLLTINFYVLSFWDKNYFKEIKSLPESEYGLVFWASVNKNSSPSLVLEDRLKSSILAYKSNKIKKIIVSGFASNDWYNEPIWMEKFLINSGVKKEDIIKDETWVDTYHSLIKAKSIVWEKSIILFTQDFQLRRAIYISEKLWLNFYWLETNLREYKKNNYFREFWARIKAFFEVEVLRKFWK